METGHRKKRKNEDLDLKSELHTKQRKRASGGSSLTLVRKYHDLQTQFQATEITYQSHFFLRSIAASAPSTFPEYQLLPKLYQVSQAFFMTELEIIVWSLYLSRIVWEQGSTDLDESLRLAALATKVYFDEEIDMYSAVLNSNMPGFHEKFTQWRQSFLLYLEISPKDISDRFKDLTNAPTPVQKTETQDYNHLINMILQLSPPLQSSLYDENPVAGKSPMEEEPVGNGVLVSGMDDRRSGATAPSCSESDSPREMSLSRNNSSGSIAEGGFHFFGFESPLPRISSLTEIWPELSPAKEQETRKA